MEHKIISEAPKVVLIAEETLQKRVATANYIGLPVLVMTPYEKGLITRYCNATNTPAPTVLVAGSVNKYVLPADSTFYYPLFVIDYANRATLSKYFKRAYIRNGWRTKIKLAIRNWFNVRDIQW